MIDPCQPVVAEASFEIHQIVYLAKGKMFPPSALPDPL
jgi:hypothetical protein